MTFLEATRVLSTCAGGEPLALLLASSANVDPLEFFVRAAAATRGRSAEVSTLPFGTLAQALFSPAPAGVEEILLLLPWDLVPECDWRTGPPHEVGAVEQLLASAQGVAERIRERNSRILYLPAALPPVFVNRVDNQSLAVGLTALAASLGARLLARQGFALGSYLSSGVPIGMAAGEVAEVVIDECLRPKDATGKVLITDFDNVLWAGLAAEEGSSGVQCGPEGIGYRHFLYQAFLARLNSAGVLLAGVSRNDRDVAVAPLQSERMQLAESDFVTILASYEPKSVHIRRLAAQLNLGLDSFVFIDDNQVEIAEVEAALPQVHCLAFPSHDDQLPEFFDRVTELFSRTTITDEDRSRTELYRRRLDTLAVAPVDGQGGDLTSFLSGLHMRLTITDRSQGDWVRALQLINKTNQFNLNGRRLTDAEVADVIAGGGRLLAARLDDRFGSHGEILACLVNHHAEIVSLVLSCRVFQRRVEHAFLVWLVQTLDRDVTLRYASTERNTPLREFLSDPAFLRHGGEVRIDRSRFASQYGQHLALFELVSPTTN